MRVIVPRDRAGSFTPGVVRKSARRTSGIDEMVISLVGKGLTTGEVAAHLKEVFGVDTSKETVSAFHRPGAGRHGGMGATRGRTAQVNDVEEVGGADDVVPGQCSVACSRPGVRRG